MTAQGFYAMGGFVSVRGQWDLLFIFMKFRLEVLELR